jgi:hypothetical protein
MSEINVEGQVRVRGIIKDKLTCRWDFVEGGGGTIVDAVLASESKPFGYFYGGQNGGGSDLGFGIWKVSYDTITATTQLPALQTSADGGWVKMTTDATSGERISVQLAGAAFSCALGREMEFWARVKFTNTTQDAFIGMSVTTTDPHASRPAGFIAFTLTADADIEYATGNASTATASADAGSDITADTFVWLYFHWNGIDTVNFYVDGVLKASSTATIPTGLVLSPIFCVESNGAAESLFVDTIQVSVDRA